MIMIKLYPAGACLFAEPEHRSLLETLEHHHVPVESQCREGYCGACRLRLRQGKVHYFRTPLAALQEGEILPCSCQAYSDIELEIAPVTNDQPVGTT